MIPSPHSSSRKSVARLRSLTLLDEIPVLTPSTIACEGSNPGHVISVVASLDEIARDVLYTSTGPDHLITFDMRGSPTAGAGRIVLHVYYQT